MGRYIAFQADYADDQACLEVLLAVVHHKVFRPQGIGAIDYRDSGDRVFLSGFGLENFVAREGPAKVSSIDVDESIKSADYLAYMKRLSAWIKRKQSPTKELSPHEHLDRKYGVTFLSSPPLLESSIAEYRKWAKQCDYLGIYLYGTFALSVSDPGDQDWKHAYRFLYDEGYPCLGAPFVMLHAHRRHESIMGPLTITVFTESLVWLHDWLDLNGQISNASADANLANLVSVAELLVTQRSTPKETALSVESQTFRRDYPRIESAFAHLLG